MVDFLQVDVGELDVVHPVGVRTHQVVRCGGPVIGFTQGLPDREDAEVLPESSGPRIIGTTFVFRPGVLTHVANVSMM